MAINAAWLLITTRRALLPSVISRACWLAVALSLSPDGSEMAMPAFGRGLRTRRVTDTA